MIDSVTAEIDSMSEILIGKLKSLQNPDGGFRAYYYHDSSSGVWTTAEIVHTLAKRKEKESGEWLEKASNYIAGCQNEDGGWPFRKNGKSITDITAWSCLALSHFKFHESIRRGLEFILSARTNSGTTNEDGWGLTCFETDRVYSTWIASYCISRILRLGLIPGDDPITSEMERALSESRLWLRSAINADGGWGISSGLQSQFTSTAVALLTLFMQGDNPLDFAPSCKFLASGLRDGLWQPEIEIVVTREGYELPQEWFTPALCFRALIFFAEFGMLSIEVLHDAFRQLQQLISSDGCVRMSANGRSDIVWALPYMVDVSDKYKLFVLSKDKEYKAFLEQQKRQSMSARRRIMQIRLHDEFPYPISHVFSNYQHELDFHRRFQLMLQLCEVAIKYSAIVGLAGYLYDKERDDYLTKFLSGAFRRPSLGDWSNLLTTLLKCSLGFRKLLYPVDVQEVLKTNKDYLDEAGEKANLYQMLSAMVHLRNSTSGHGALRTLYEYKLLVEKEDSRLYSFFDRLQFLATSNSFLVLASQYDEFGEGDRYKIRIFKGLDISDSDLETLSRLSEGQRETFVRYIYFQNTSNNTIVNLYPFLSYMFCNDCVREHFFFYNSFKDGNRVSYLSYDCGHTVEVDNASHFRKRLEASGVNWG